MAVQFDPIAKDESLNTTELTPRNVADVLAQELSNIATSISGGSDKVPKTDIATVEPTNVASRAYNIGELVYVNGNLYKVITAIASGATFTVGTNIQSTNVSGTVKDALDEVNVIKEVGNFKTNGTYTWSNSIENSKIFLVSLTLNNQMRQIVLMCSRQELFKTNGIFPDFMTSDGRVYCQITANDSGYTVSQLSGLSNVSANASLVIQTT